MAGTMRVTRATLAVLQAIAGEPERWHYGYDLLTSSGLKSGSLYPILIRLCEHGFLESAWENETPRGRPARHLYRLTDAGKDLVRATRPVGTGTGRLRPRAAL